MQGKNHRSYPWSWNNGLAKMSFSFILLTTHTHVRQILIILRIVSKPDVHNAREPSNDEATKTENQTLSLD